LAIGPGARLAGRYRDSAKPRIGRVPRLVASARVGTGGEPDLGPESHRAIDDATAQVGTRRVEQAVPLLGRQGRLERRSSGATEAAGQGHGEALLDSIAAVHRVVELEVE